MIALQELAAEVLSRDDDDPAIQFEGRWHTWAEVRSLARAVQGLVEASGAHVRAPVLYLARNMPEPLAALLGLIADTRSIRMLYSFQSPAAIAKEIARLRPAVIVGAEQDLGGELPAAICESGAAAIALHDMQALALPGLDQSRSGLDPDFPVEATIEIQTSGTTGPPKRFPVTYDQAYRHFVEPMALSDGTGEEAAPDPALLYMSVGNLSGMMGTLAPLLFGWPMILHDRFSLDAWRDYVRTYRPVRGGLQPAAVQMLMDIDAPPEELSSLRSLMVGSAPLDPRVHRAFEARYGIPVLLAYGATEFYGTAVAMTPELYEQWGDSKFGSVGQAVPGVRLRTVDPETGAVCEPGKTGLIEVFSEAIDPDWIRTSDLGMIDEDGFLFMRGRADGAINRGGFKLLPETIEQGLLCHDAVSATAVVGVPDRRLGEVPGAAVQFKPGAKAPDWQELEAHLRQQVPATHIPRHWRAVTQLPRTTSMKVDRGAVARLFS